MNLKSEKELVTEYAKAFNHLDIKFIKDIVDDDFYYTSHKVYGEMNGKKRIFRLFEAKI